MKILNSSLRFCAFTFVLVIGAYVAKNCANLTNGDLYEFSADGTIINFSEYGYPSDNGVWSVDSLEPGEKRLVIRNETSDSIHIVYSKGLMLDRTVLRVGAIFEKKPFRRTCVVDGKTFDMY